MHAFFRLRRSSDGRPPGAAVAAALLLAVHWLAATAPLPPVPTLVLDAPAATLASNPGPATQHIIPDTPAEIARAPANAPAPVDAADLVSPAGAPAFSQPFDGYVSAAVIATATAGQRNAGPRARAPPLSV